MTWHAKSLSVPWRRKERKPDQTKRNSSHLFSIRKDASLSLPGYPSITLRSLFLRGSLFFLKSNFLPSSTICRYE